VRATIHASLAAAVPTNLFIDAPLHDPSPVILALNAALGAFDSIVPAYIPPAVYTRSTAGLASLMDTALLSLCTSRVVRMNAHGCAHMQLNILVLQQNLKNIESRASLPLSATYFDLFTAGPDAIVARAKQFGRDFGAPEGLWDQGSVKRLLEMTYEERLMGENRESSVGARRALDGKVLEISEFMY
jgi:exocyst complex component 4